MDLVYTDRFSIIFLFVNPVKDEGLTRHIRDAYRGNKQRIFERAQLMVQAGLIDKRVLNGGESDVFLFKYTTLMTTRIISLQIYAWDVGCKHVKPVYLTGILSCFEPYLTIKGKKDYEDAIQSVGIRG